ncbi:MAG: GNAT family N-acetyltransferase [Bacillota bacterium]|nr:GNAT family N-acetyltransferase [Bacillota bacterium]
MSIHYEVISEEEIICIKDMCDGLMAYQKSKASIHPEWFDNMCFETRLVPSVKGAKANYIVAAKDGDEIVGYAYSNICPKRTYSGGFATLEPVDFFDFDSVENEDVGCLSQFFIKENYRGSGIGSVLFDKSMEWLNSFKRISDRFIFVSNGNEGALRFYQHKGFRISHEILNGFIIVMRNTRPCFQPE